MTLKEFLIDYEANAGPHDLLTIYYREPSGSLSRICLNEKSAEKREALLSADLTKAEILQSEYCDPFKPGRGGKCLCYHAEIDQDQALLALGIHPLTKRERPRARRAFKL